LNLIAGFGITPRAIAVPVRCHLCGIWHLVF
jgi:hypothetical protein